MGGDNFRIPVLSIEQQRHLHQLWMHITLALVLTGHSADLREALDSACGSPCRGQPWTDSAQRYVVGILSNILTGENEQLGSSLPVTPTPVPRNTHQSPWGLDFDLSAGGDRPEDNYLCRGDIEADGTASDPEESDDCGMDDFFDVPLDLIAQSADLSHHRNDRQASDNMPSVELAHTSTTGKSASADASSIPAVSRQPESIATSAYQSFDIATGPPVAEHYYTGCAAENAPSPEADTVGQARTSRKNMSGRLSVKRDLTAAEIGSAAEVLLRDDARSFFLCHSQSISAAWAASALAARGDGIVPSVVAAFDEVHRLTRDDRCKRLPLRFAHLQLKYALDALHAAATKDRLRVRRKPGYSNASLAIDIYLNTKRNHPGEIPSRDRLSEYRRVSTRWPQLAGTSPLQLSVYSDAAETIMCVTPVSDYCRY
jgi:hypothetical protein